MSKSLFQHTEIDLRECLEILEERLNSVPEDDDMTDAEKESITLVVMLCGEILNAIEYRVSGLAQRVVSKDPIAFIRVRKLMADDWSDS